MSRLIVIGAGDVGGRVAARWVAESRGQAIGVTRTPTRHEALRARGVIPRIGSPRDHIQPGDRVLLSTSGSASQSELAAELPPLTARSVMTSSTGYYTGRDGTLRPGTPPGEAPRAAAAVRAEAHFRHASQDGVILRLGGLYRRGRGPQEALRRRGRPLLGPAARPLPLIHIDDVVSAILAALTHAEPAPVYLGVTQPVATRQAYYTLACEILGLDAPEFEGDAKLRCFEDTRFQADLLPEPAWPSWAEGLEHALAQEG